MKKTLVFIILIPTLCWSQITESLPVLTNKGKVAVYIEPTVSEATLTPYKKIIQDNPGTAKAAEAQFAIAAIYFDAGAYGGAMREYRKVVEQYNQSSFAEDAQYYLAQSLSKLKADSAAVEEGQKLLQNYSQTKWSDEAHALIATGLLRLQKYDEAIQECKNNLNTKYKDDAWMTTGNAYRLSKRYKEAISAFESVTTGSEKRGEAQYEIGITNKMARDYQSAITELKKVLTLSPKSSLGAMAQYELATTYLSLNEQQKALEEFQKVVDQYPKEREAPYASFHIGELLMKQKQYDKAVDQFKKTETTFSDFPHKDWLLFFTGKSYYDSDRKGQARPYFQQLISQYPTSSLKQAAEKMLAGS